MIEAATALAFSVFENHGVYALLLGSGVSRGAEIPTGWELTLSLTQRLAALEGVDGDRDWNAWHNERFGEPPNYSKLLDALAPTAGERRSVIHGFVEPSAQDLVDGRRVPTPAHRAIAKLVRDGFVRVIITTNFDRLLEIALNDEGVQPVVIKSDDDLRGATPLTHTRCFVLKLHGDYLDTRIRNTECELETYTPALDECLDRIFDEHGLIVCGWSAEWDCALRAAIQRAPNRRYSLFWGCRGEPSALAQDVIAHRGGRTIPIESADAFFGRLQRDVETQAEPKRANPRSVELLVASAKRYLAKAEHRIELSDLILDETRRAHQRVAEEGLAWHGRAEHVEFRRRILLYESTYEGLTRVLFAMGRWGLGVDFELATELLKGLANHPQQNGQTLWLALRSYPAALAMYAYGIGLVQADRLGELRRWLTTPLSDPYNQGQSYAVAKLFLWNWGANQEDGWRSFEGLDRHKTPLSEYLFQRLSRWTGTETSNPRTFEISFEQFELFAGLADLEMSVSKDDLSATLSAADPNTLALVPVGRTLWNERERNEIVGGIFSKERTAHVLAAGFGKGDPEYLTLAAKNLKRIFVRLRYR